MRRMFRWRVVEQLVESGFLPLFYCPDADQAIALVEACVQGGAQAIEFTNRGPEALEVFRAVLKTGRRRWPHLVFGLGTVTEPVTAAQAIHMGADFLVSPFFSEEVARLCNLHGIAYIPGCSVPGDVARALEWGADLVKIFPAKSLGGPSYLKTLRDIFPKALFMPTGGVSPDPAELEAWFRAGAACVGLGSALFSPTHLASGNWEVVEEAVRAVNRTVRTLRDKSSG